MNRSAPLLRVENLHHYTVSVASIEEAARWYCDTLGFRWPPRRLAHEWGSAAQVPGPGCLLEMFEMPDARPVPDYARGPEPDTDLTVCGHKHMALLLAGTVDEAVDRLRAAHARVADVKLVSLEGIGEFKAVFIADSTGGLIELPEDDNAGDPAATGGAADGEAGGGSRLGPVGIKGLHHVALCTPDREEAMEWYARVFGFNVATTFEIPAIGLRTAMMQGPGFWVELHSKAGARPVPAERRDPRTDLLTLGNKYFALGVDDLTGVAEMLRENGVQVGRDVSAGGSRRLFVSDNCGNPIELCQELTRTHHHGPGGST